MRDPKRIKRILKEIETLWELVPDQRLGQLLQNYVFGRGDIFFQEDDKSEKIIVWTVKDHLDRINGKEQTNS